MRSIARLFPIFDASSPYPLLATSSQSPSLATDSQDQSAPTQTSLIDYPGSVYLANRQAQRDSRLLSLPAELLHNVLSRLPDTSLIAVARTSAQGYVFAASHYPERTSLSFSASSLDPQHAFLAPGYPQYLPAYRKDPSAHSRDDETKKLVRVLTYACSVPESNHQSDQDSEEFWIARGYPTASSYLDKDYVLLTPSLEALHIFMTGTEEASVRSCHHVCPQVGIVGRITDKTTLKTVTSKVSPGICDSFWTVFPQLQNKTANGRTRCDTLIVEESDANSLKERWGYHPNGLIFVSSKSQRMKGGTDGLVDSAAFNQLSMIQRDAYDLPAAFNQLSMIQRDEEQLQAS